MNKYSIENILNEVPAVVCTAGSNIIAVQDKTSAGLSDSIMGRALFDHMDPCDIVKFSAHFYDERIENIFRFALWGFSPFSYGIAVFRKILKRRYAVVFLFEDRSDDVESMASVLSKNAEAYTGYELLSAFTHMNDMHSEKSSDIHVIDAVEVAEYLIDHGYCSNLYIRTLKDPLSKKEIRSMLLNVPRCVFLQIIMLTLRILEALSVRRAVKLSFYKFADSLEMRFVTDRIRLQNAVSDAEELIESCPATGVYVGLLEYVCRLYNARADVFTDEGSGSFSLILTFYNDAPDLLDFKSCDFLEGIDEELEAVAKITDLITYKEEEQG